jgi:hypothetical protein
MGVSTSFDNWLAAGNKGGFRRSLAASRTNNFRNNSTVFYHGTSSEFGANIRSTGIDLSYGRPNADFGSGFYVSSQRDTALWSGTRLYGDNVDIVTFRVSNQQLEKLDNLTFDSPSGDWADFVKFHKDYAPTDLMHGGDVYDTVTGPLVRRFSSTGQVLDWSGRVQTSINTQQGADLFNRSIK